MAFSLSPLHQDLSCPICYEVYKDPVMLFCGHSFCKACLQSSWTFSSERECPICRRRSSREHPPADLTLRNACESYLQQKEGSRSQGIQCSLHTETLNLFCVDDEKLVCGKCVTQYHQNHSFCSISKAAKPHKETIQSSLRTLEEKLKMFKHAKNISDKVAVHIKSQFQQTEKQIQLEFEKLHQFLKTEEKVRLFNLRQEEEEKSQNIKMTIDELDKHIKEISIRITETQNKLNNDALLIQDLKITMTRSQYTVPDPQPDPGALIDVAKHLGNLSYRVGEMMENFLLKYPVVLDPNTANSSLSISSDLSSVSTSTENHQLPHNPERFSVYNGVLGSEGFSSGTHSWVVDVGDSYNWIIGVAEESVNRKESIGAIPENGFYTIWRKDNNIFAGINSSEEKIIVPLTLRRVCVTLDWGKGWVIFSNNDTNKALHTFKCTFKNKMYPYFYNTSKTTLKILPLQVSNRDRI